MLEGFSIYKNGNVQEPSAILKVKQNKLKTANKTEKVLIR